MAGNCFLIRVSVVRIHPGVIGEKPKTIAHNRFVGSVQQFTTAEEYHGNLPNFDPVRPHGE